MTALATERSTLRNGDAAAIELHSCKLAASVKIYKGSLVMLDAGYLKPGAASTTAVALGKAEDTVDNSTGAAGAKSVDVRSGAFWWANSSAGDAIAQADVGNVCYVVDDQTVAKTSNSQTRIPAGTIEEVDSEKGVLVSTYLSSGANPVSVAQGGTGLATITDHAVMVGSATAAVTPIAVGTDGQVLAGQTGADPSFVSLSGAVTMSAAGVATLGRAAFGAATAKTVAAGGDITLTAGKSYYTIAGAGGVADDLDIITGGAAGDIIFLRAVDDAVDIRLRDKSVAGGGANIITPGAETITLAEDDDFALLVYAGTDWTVVAFKTLANGGGGLGAALASTSASKGASLVGIQDSASLITATNVETALAEIIKLIPISLADPGTGQPIPVTRSATVNFTIGAGAETNTLAIPASVGQELVLFADAVGGGTRAVTCAQAVNVAGNTVMTFNAARDCAVLKAVTVGTALRWEIVANNNVALS